MPTTVILDEWQLTFRIPADLPDAEVDAIRAVLDDPQFLARLRTALRRVLLADPELTPVRVTVGR
jgi:hypothetical protein